MSGESKKSVKHWPEDERPRERLIAHGPASLSDAQLLAIIIKMGTPGRSALDLALELLSRFESLAGIEQAGIDTDPLRQHAGFYVLTESLQNGLRA